MTAVFQTVSDSLTLSVLSLSVCVCAISTVFSLKSISNVKFLCHFDNEASIKFNGINTRRMSRREQWIIMMQTEFQFNHAEIIIILEIFGRFSQQFECISETFE